MTDPGVEMIIRILDRLNLSDRVKQWYLEPAIDGELTYGLTVRNGSRDILLSVPKGRSRGETEENLLKLLGKADLLPGITDPSEVRNPSEKNGKRFGQA